MILAGILAAILVAPTPAVAAPELPFLESAREMLLRSVEAGDRNELRDEDWLIIGRLTEQYGVAEAAIEAYGKIEKPENPTPPLFSPSPSAGSPDSRPRERPTPQ